MEPAREWRSSRRRCGAALAALDRGRPPQNQEVLLAKEGPEGWGFYAEDSGDLVSLEEDAQVYIQQVPASFTSENGCWGFRDDSGDFVSLEEVESFSVVLIV